MSNRNSIKSKTEKENKKTKDNLVETLKTIGLFLLLCLLIFVIVNEVTHRPLHVENKDGLAYVGSAIHKDYTIKELEPYYYEE